MIEKNFNFFFNPISKTKGIGPKIQKLFNEKKIESNIDLIFNFPYGLIDRTHCPKLNNLEIGKISTIFVKVKKHNFPRLEDFQILFSALMTLRLTLFFLIQEKITLKKYYLLTVRSLLVER